MAPRPRIARRGLKTAGILFSLGALLCLAVGTAAAYLTSTDMVVNYFSPQAQTRQNIVAFYCESDNSVNFAAINPTDVQGDPSRYTIAGKTCTQYYDAQEDLDFDDQGTAGPFFACNRDDSKKVWDSKYSHISKVCFLTPLQPHSMAGWLRDTGRIDKVEGLENLDTSQLENLRLTFSRCSGQAVAQIIGALDTSSVTTMEGCFRGAHMEGWNMSGWDTSSVRDFRSTFESATGENLDLSSWDVSQAQTMDRMFYCAFWNYYIMSDGYESTDVQAACTPHWWGLDISGWQPERLVSYKDMFFSCCTQSVDLSGFANSAIGQNPGLDSSFIKEVAVGNQWIWDNVAAGITPWFSISTHDSYRNWDTVKGQEAPPNCTAATYDRSALFAVLYDGELSLYRVLNRQTDDPEEDKWGMYYETFQRYNKGYYDAVFPLDYKQALTSATEVPWREHADQITAVSVKSDIAPLCMDWWFDGLSSCAQFSLERLDARQCSLGRPLFSGCSLMNRLSIGENWEFPAESGTFAQPQPGIWYANGTEYRETDSLPKPGTYWRQNPVAFMTTDKVLHLADGRVSVKDTFNGKKVIAKTSLGLDWLDSLAPATPWSTWDYRSVVVETPLKPRSCERWFYFSPAEKMDLSKLNTTEASSLRDMFAFCYELSDVTLGEDFDFRGTGQTNQCQLPDDMWKDQATGYSYYASMIPNRTAARYTRGLEWRALLYDSPTDETTLEFRFSKPIAAGETTADGYEIKEVFTGFDQSTYYGAADAPWHSHRSQIQKVVVADPLAPAATSYWFTDFTSCNELDLGSLDTTDCSSMNLMFKGCAAKRITVGDRFSFEGRTGSRLCSFDEGTWKAEGTGAVYQRPQNIPSFQAETYLGGLIAQAIFLENKDLRFVLADKLLEAWMSSYDGLGVRWSCKFDDISSASIPWLKEVGFGSQNIPSSAKRVIAEAPLAPKSIAGWFKGFTACEEIDLDLLDVSNCTSLEETFYECESLVSINIASWDVSQMTTMASGFFGAKVLPRVDVSSWQPEKCTSFASLFARCWKLAEIDLSRWTANKCTSFSGMFSGCSALTSLDLSALSPQAPANYTRMFGSCSKLQELDISNLAIRGACDLYYMFENCSALTTIYGQDWEVGSCKYPNDTFKGCTALTGQNGSTLASIGHTRAISARIDREEAPGLFTSPPEAS